METLNRIFLTEAQENSQASLSRLGLAGAKEPSARKKSFLNPLYPILRNNLSPSELQQIAPHERSLAIPFGCPYSLFSRFHFCSSHVSAQTKSDGERNLSTKNHLSFTFWIFMSFQIRGQSHASAISTTTLFSTRLCNSALPECWMRVKRLSRVIDSHKSM